MIEKFHQLNQEKQKRILDAAFTEFTNKNFEDASTNAIAKNAGIGKGTLFYYFETKKKLFYFLVEQAFELAHAQYLSKVNLQETDFFIRFKETTELKLKVYSKHGAALGFIAKVFLRQEKYDLPVDLQVKINGAQKLWNAILKENIDLSKFREDIPGETALKFVQWTMEGYRAQLEAEFKYTEKLDFTEENLQPYYDEFFEYLDTLKRVYYKLEFAD